MLQGTDYLKPGKILQLATSHPVMCRDPYMNVLIVPKALKELAIAIDITRRSTMLFIPINANNVRLTQRTTIHSPRSEDI